MFVRDYMATDLITVTPQDTIGDALSILKENSIKRLPVCEKGKLVGIVSKQDLLKASPSPASSLSIWEINYLFPRILLQEVMVKKVVTISADSVLEEAAVLMKEKNVSSLLVLEVDKLVGIITESDIFKALIEIFGFSFPGVRITISVKDEIGVLWKITKIISEKNLNIISIVITRPEKGKGKIIIRIETDDVSLFRDSLEKEGVEILHMIKS